MDENKTPQSRRTSKETAGFSSLKGSLSSKKLPIEDARARFFDLVKKLEEDPEIQAFLEENKERLNPDAAKVGRAKLWEYYTKREKNKADINAGIGGYVPQLAVSNGNIILNYHPGDALAAKREQQARKNRVRILYNPDEATKILRSASFENVKYDSGGKSTRNTVATAVGELFDRVSAAPDKFHRGLYIYGSVGVGKTYLMAALANELGKDLGDKFESCMVYFPELLDILKRALRRDDSSFESQINYLQEVPFLILDDIGASRLSDWERDEVLGVIVQKRMQAQRLTCFTSNLTIDQFDDQMSIGRKNNNQAEGIAAARIIDRILYLAKPIYLDGKNYRRPDDE